MMRFLCTLVILLIVIPLFCFTKDELLYDLSFAETTTQQMEILHKYFKMASSIEDQRVIQDAWREIDEEACLEYYQTDAEQHPDDLDRIYLNLRLQGSGIQLQECRRILQDKQMHEYLNRMFSLCIIEKLYANDSESYIRSAVYRADKELLRAISEKQQDAYVMMSIFIGSVLERNYVEAESVLGQLSDFNVLNSNWDFIQSFIVETRNYQLWSGVVQISVDHAIAQGDIEPTAKSLVVSSQVLYTMLLAEDFDAALSFISVNPLLKEEPYSQQLVLDLYLASKDIDRAFQMLNVMVDAGSIGSGDLNDPKYASLASSKQWKKLAEKAAKQSVEQK